MRAAASSARNDRRARALPPAVGGSASPRPAGSTQLCPLTAQPTGCSGRSLSIRVVRAPRATPACVRTRTPSQGRVRDLVTLQLYSFLAGASFPHTNTNFLPSGPFLTSPGHPAYFPPKRQLLSTRGPPGCLTLSKKAASAGRFWPHVAVTHTQPPGRCWLQRRVPREWPKVDGTR